MSVTFPSYGLTLSRFGGSGPRLMDKLGKADALWQAKMALKAEGHPLKDWAGWVLTGDPE